MKQVSVCVYEWIIESLTQIIKNRLIQEWNTAVLLWHAQMLCSSFVWNGFHWRIRKNNKKIKNLKKTDSVPKILLTQH